jgi:uncharacterized protein
MRNIIGQPVTGEDFFPRPDLVKRIRRALDAKMNISLTGPVKSGKTSLLLHLRDTITDYNFIYIDAGTISTEFYYYEAIYDRLGQSPFFNKGYESELGPNKCFDGIKSLLYTYRNDKPLVVLIDDFSPILLEYFNEGNVKGISRFLKNNKNLRESINKALNNVHFIYCSSHNLEEIVKSNVVYQTVNDLYSILIPTLTQSKANEFILLLSRQNDINLDSSGRDLLIQKLQWLNPYLIQIIIYELGNIELEGNGGMTVDFFLNLALKKVLNHKGYFDQWLKSIESFLEQFELNTLHDLLNLFTQINGTSISDITYLSEGILGIPYKETINVLSPLLKNEYIILDSEKYYFGSPLFKAWWSQNRFREIDLPALNVTQKKKQEFKSIKVNRINILNVKCFGNMDITFDDSTNTSVIIGTNGKGKSTILQLIALALSGIETVPFPYNWKDVIKRDHDIASFDIDLQVEEHLIQLTFDIDKNDAIKCVKGKKKLEALKDHFLLLAYGANRSIKLEETRPNKEVEPIATLFGENGYLKHIKISSTFEYVTKQFDNFKELINKVLEKANGNYPVEMIRFDAESFYFSTPSNPKGAIPIEGLSEGYKSTFVWLFDAIIRILERGGKLENAKDITGVVLIDEIDLHLHPTWQRTILNSIQSLFPNIQFIVTTHSPFVVQGVKKDSLVVLEMDIEKNSVVVIDKGITSELSYSAIVREIFNIDSPFNIETEQKIKQFREMGYTLRDGKKIDIEKFKTLVLDIAERGVELDGIMRREIRSLEQKTGKKLNLWKK